MPGKKLTKKGFTLIEILIVMGIVGALATGIIIAIKPGARFAQMRDMKRKENLERIYSAIQNKLLSEGGAWIGCEEIPFEPTFIGKGEGNYDLYSCLVPTYLSKELYDPKDGNAENSGYEIWRTGLGEIGLRAKRERPPGYIIVGALPTLPIVTTLEPKNITDVSAETGGKVHHRGDSEVSERGVVYDTMPRPTIEDRKITAGSGLGEFEVTLSFLEPETTYYVRAYAINESGVAYGPEYSFKTQTPTFPRITTKEASNIRVHSAVLNGEILSLGMYTSVSAYFQYRKKGESGWPNETSKILVGQTGPFSQIISGLDEETTYEFRFLADYTDGRIEGEILEFTTLSTDPVVKTLEAQDVTWNSATLKGDLVSLGIYSQVDVYFLSRKVGEASWLMTGLQTKTAPGEFLAQISNLTEETQYEFKAVAGYDGKKVEGDVLVFSTTSIPPPSVETLNAISRVEPGLLEVTFKGNLIDLGGYSSVEGYFRYRKKGETGWQE
ncbi:MAG: prepilin-type N-terminal cleavage/methylation domain-containing protein, partial [Candidatus Pacebacteria bacterium]|nr:prepilin-type N-terminal cleavage/methylation domain-containing protein [Candidatus Paceibacterota bacterium]